MTTVITGTISTHRGIINKHERIGFSLDERYQKTNFYEDRPYMYHVGLDSHDCYPVSMDQVIEDMNNKVTECKDML